MLRQPPTSFAIAFVAAAVLIVTGDVAGQTQVFMLKAVEATDLPQEIERLARDYRIQTYASYRTNRPEYDRRRAALDEVLDAWREGGSRQDDISLLTMWLNQTTHYAAENPARPLPPTPLFGIDRWPSAADDSTTAPNVIGDASPPAQQSESEIADPGQGEPRLVEPTPDHPNDMDWLLDPSFEQPTTDESVISSRPPPDEIPPSTVDATESEPLAGVDPWSSTQRDQSEFPAAPPVDVFAGGPSILGDVGANDPSYSAGPGISAAKRIGEPDEFLPIPATEMFGEAASVSTNVRPEQPRVRVNLIELAARIKGFNLGLQALDAELLRRSDYDASDVSRILKRLEELLPSYQNVALYWNAITEDDRVGMDEISPAGEIIASLADRLIRLRRTLEIDPMEPPALRRVRQDLLDSLTHQLTNISEQYRTIESGIIH